MTPMQIGIFTVGDVTQDPTDGTTPTENARIKALVEIAKKTEEVGLDVVVPDERDLDEGVYWDALSWENADTYDVDVALWDTRGGRQHLERLQDQPIWGRTTAARDDAYLPWRFEVAPSARGYADVLDAYADDLRSLARS